MHRLLDPDEWTHLYNNAIWTAADIKVLEKQMEPTKATLVACKTKTNELEIELSKMSEHLCNRIKSIILVYIFIIVYSE